MIMTGSMVYSHRINLGSENIFIRAVGHVGNKCIISIAMREKGNDREFYWNFIVFRLFWRVSYAWENESFFLAQFPILVFQLSLLAYLIAKPGKQFSKLG